MPTFNLLYVISIIRKYLWYIVGVVGATTLAAIIYTMPYFYPPQFASSAIVYPASSERYDFWNLIKDHEVYLYGNAKEAEKIINFAGSESVAMFVIDSLDLWKEYDIDPKGTSPKYYALEEFYGNIDIKKAEGAGVQILAYDIDPQRAADIVNLIIYKVNQLNRDLMNHQRKEIIRIYEGVLNQHSQLYQSYQDTTKEIREKYNIFSYREQTEVMVEQVMQAQANYADKKAKFEVMEKQYAANDTNVINARARLRGAEAQLKAMSGGNSEISLTKFRDGLDKLVFMEQNTFAMVGNVQIMKNKINALKLMQGMDFETVIIQQEPTAGDRKVRPVRSIIIIVTFLVALMVSIGSTIFIDRTLPYLANKS